MSVFGSYARYYDLLYQDKDYTNEARFIMNLLNAHAPEAESLLELGSGTGAHAALLAEHPYIVHGIDMSTDMLERAEQRRATLPASLAESISFSQGDIRDVRLNTTFDAVLSLFHVMSYQPTNADLQAAFTTARTHMQEDGIFIFDCWYGPAVLTDRPVTRVKNMENTVIKITRIAQPTVHPNENLVDVNYHVFITDKASGSVEEITETHRMRYLFKPEIEDLFMQTGFAYTDCGEWMTGRAPGFDTWGVYFVGRAH